MPACQWGKLLHLFGSQFSHLIWLSFILMKINPEYSLEELLQSWNANVLATWCKELTNWKRPWCWKRLRIRGEVDNRGGDGWMASSIQWTWVWANSRRWWRTGKPGMLQSMVSQGVRHIWATEQQHIVEDPINIDTNEPLRRASGSCTEFMSATWLTSTFPPSSPPLSPIRKYFSS